MFQPDLINAGFELGACLFVLDHCRTVLRDKSVAGVSIAAVVFFSALGLWNLFYYPHLGQMVSFYCGISIVVANTVYFFLLLKYRRRPATANLIEKESNHADRQK